MMRQCAQNQVQARQHFVTVPQPRASTRKHAARAQATIGGGSATFTTRQSSSASATILRNPTTNQQIVANNIVPAPAPLPKVLAPCSPRSDAFGESKIKVLFVCQDNTVFGPASESCFSSAVERACLHHRFMVKSVGLGGGNPTWYQEGEYAFNTDAPIDPKLLAAARQRGLDVDQQRSSSARTLRPSDLSKYDIIVAHSQADMEAVMQTASYWSARPQGCDLTPSAVAAKLLLLTDYCREYVAPAGGLQQVPEVGGQHSYSLMLAMVADAAEGLLGAMCRQLQLAPELY